MEGLSTEAGDAGQRRDSSGKVPIQLQAAVQPWFLHISTGSLSQHLFAAPSSFLLVPLIMACTSACFLSQFVRFIRFHNRGRAIYVYHRQNTLSPFSCVVSKCPCASQDWSLSGSCRAAAASPRQVSLSVCAASDIRRNERLIQLMNAGTLADAFAAKLLPPHFARPYRLFISW